MSIRATHIGAISLISMATCLLLGSAIFSFMVFWLLLSLTVFLISLSIATKTPFIKYTGIGLFSLTLPITLLEGFFLLTSKAPLLDIEKQLNSPISTERMQDLNPSEQYTQKQVQRFSTTQDTLLFDITTTHDSKGRRITPYAPQAKTAIVLLGCSFTFGAGIEDEETFAYKLGKMLGKDYQVFNFGKSGIGSHQILELLENDIPDLEKYSKIQFYYFAIQDHLRRIVGAASWDNKGPLYDVHQGKAIKIGTLADLRPFYKNKQIYFWVKRSHLYKKIQPHLDIYMEQFLPRYALEKRLELQKALMTTMEQVIAEKYTQSSFTILFWPPETTLLMHPLIENTPWVDMEQWLPEFEINRDKYVIAYPEEPHPSAFANDIVARKMAELVKKEN